MNSFLFFPYRAGEYACTAYVTFKDAYALETAVLLTVSLSLSHLLQPSLFLKRKKHKLYQDKTQQ